MGTLAELQRLLSPKEYQQLVALVGGGVVAASAMDEKVDSHLRFLQEAADDDEFVEMGLGAAVAGVLHQLIAGLDGLANEEEQQIVSAAVEYFVLASDVDDDVRSPIGLEDDVRVVNAVAAVLGRDDLRI